MLGEEVEARLQEPPVLRRKGWQQKYINLSNFDFFPFWHNNDYVPEILAKHKVDLVTTLLSIISSTKL